MTTRGSLPPLWEPTGVDPFRPEGGYLWHPERVGGGLYRLWDPPLCTDVEAPDPLSADSLGWDLPTDRWEHWAARWPPIAPPPSLT